MKLTIAVISLFLLLFNCSCSNYYSSIAINNVLPQPSEPQSENQQPVPFLANSEALNNFRRQTVVLIKIPGNYSNSDNTNTIGQDHSAYCAGVMINNEEVLTASHCVARLVVSNICFGSICFRTRDIDWSDPPIGDVKKIAVYEYFDEEDEIKEYLLFEVVRWDSTKDLALLRLLPEQIRTFNHSVVNITNRSELRLGESVYAMGSPLGLTWTLTDGIVSRERIRIENEPFNTLFTQCSTDIFYGNSGGPLVDEQGNLVGIASMMAGESWHLAFFIHPSVIQEFLEE